MALGWMLLALVGAEPATVEPTHEAVCGLKNLFTAEFAHLGERDRYEPSLERIGFRPLPCPDATRPAVSGENSAGGCRFVFTVTQAGNSREALRAEAVGVGPGVQGMRFVLDAQARITRTDSRQPVVEPDCEAWRRAADPLWRYHDAVAEHDCVSGPYAAEHPCAVALADLAAQARAGVGVAQKEYAAHPTAKELVPLEPPTPAMTLCGLLASKEDRARAIAPLEQDGTLVATLLGPRCHPDGLSVALPRVLRRLEAVCPEESCLKLLALARDVRLPDLDTLIQSHAATLAEAIIRPQPQDYHSERISVVMGLTQTQASVFTEAVKGKWSGLRHLEGVPGRPLELTLLDRARLAHPELAPRVTLARELMGQGLASPAVFRAWTQAAPCMELDDAHLLKLSPERLRLIAETQARCPGNAVSILERYTAQLPPPELMRVLEPLTNEQLGWFHASALGLVEPERAKALVDWAVERQPRLVEMLPGTLPVLQRLLAPRNAERLGGRDAVIDFLMRRRGGWVGSLDEEALPVFIQEALQGTPSPERVRGLTTYGLPPATLNRLLAGVLNSPDARLRAAAAGGLAQHVASVIPGMAARDCLAEVRVGFQCIEAAAQRLGPPPEGRRSWPVFGGPLSPLDAYCVQWNKDTRTCQRACAGETPDETALARLEKAARESLPRPAAWRACDHQR